MKSPALSELLNEVTTQADFARMVGVSEAAVSGMVGSGVLVRGETAHEWIMSYCDHLREMAAGRASSGGLDLASERARLAAEQADRIAMQNKVTRGELAPVVLIERVLENAASKIAGVLDALPGVVRRRLPQLTADDIDAVRAEVSKVRNTVANMSLADLIVLGEEEEAEVPLVPDASAEEGAG
jgi:phage terminase Nu1 subunit (DNA packaging protein)